jgi:1-pyrroline-5-carboxylate dehydrogenase
MTSARKVTYVSLGADDPEVNAALDAAFTRAKSELGRRWPMHVAGERRTTAATTPTTNPADTRMMLAEVPSATADDVDEAVRVARAAFPSWRRTPWPERAALLDKAAGLIRAQRERLTAWLVLEMGKNRVEALGEVEETADLFTYYTAEMRAHDGYVQPMGRLAATDTNTSVLRPYGVWAVISPWNFPYALLGAPAAAALLTGNTVIMKPSSETPLTGLLLAEIFAEAGLPAGTFQCLTGSGRVVGEGLAHHPGVDGLTFTGSYEVGFHQLFQRFAKTYPKPCIVEMGGKNPALVMPSADLDQAARGVYRSAFGMNGHKCSACSRLYVHQDVLEPLLARLDALIDDTIIGDPSHKETFLGPLATQASRNDYQKFVALAGRDGRIRRGGRLLTEGPLAHGYFAAPTLVEGLPDHHALVRDELFVPLLVVQPVSSFDEALARANDTVFGLTAGIFTQNQAEIDAFLDGIEAGVVYVNRAAGATTGAWPGVQPFGGWKGSGSTGKNIGGHHTLPCYLREQSRTVCQ